MACSDDRVSLLKAGMCKSDQPNECGSDFMNGSFFSRILGEGVNSHHDCKVTFFFPRWGGVGWQEFYSEWLSDVDFIRNRRKLLRQRKKIGEGDPAVPHLDYN